MNDVPAPAVSSKPRPRSPIRKVTVESVEPITPLLRRVVLQGDALVGFGPPRPAAHIKLHMVPQGASWSPDDETAPRPPRRTYTPRSFDPVARRLAVDFVLHGHGIASDWAQHAKPGQTLFVSGPGGGYDVPTDAKSIVLVADDTALPAVGMILEAMPPGCKATVLAEVANRSEQRPLAPSGAHDVVWLHRDETNAVPGTLLEAAARDLAASQTDSLWWVACEAAAMRRIRKHLMTEAKLDHTCVHTRGYWKHGEIAYPDHDYGND
jgi:NADPH-dependent ferric siderophore reductase